MFLAHFQVQCVEPSAVTTSLSTAHAPRRDAATAPVENQLGKHAVSAHPLCFITRCVVTVLSWPVARYDDEVLSKCQERAVLKYREPLNASRALVDGKP